MFLKTVSIRGLALIAVLTGGSTHAADLNIMLTDIKNSNGSIRVAVFDSESTFNKKPLRTVSVPAQTGEMEINVTDLPEGDYAVMLYQDMDDNEKLDTNLLGIPREPWGASLGGKSVFGAPDWEGTRFSLAEPDTKITITMR